MSSLQAMLKFIYNSEWVVREMVASQGDLYFLSSLYKHALHSIFVQLALLSILLRHLIEFLHSHQTF